MIKPNVHDGLDDGVDVDDPAASNSDGDTAARRDGGHPRRSIHLCSHGAIDIGERAVREALADRNQARKGHGTEL